MNAPAPKSRTTRYEIQEGVAGATPEAPPMWAPVAVVESASARGAIREWYETNESDSTTPLRMRAVPVRNITQLTIAFETHRQLTFS